MNKYVAEFLGTLFFLYVILATGKAIPIGLALTAAILVLGKFSGGNFNPAVSVMMAAAGKLPGYRQKAVTNSALPPPTVSRTHILRMSRTAFM